MDQTNRRCTVQLAGGAFCDVPSMIDAPFPICPSHALRLYRDMRDTVVARGDGLAELGEECVRLAVGDDMWALLATRSGVDPEPFRTRDVAPVVYYLRFNGTIKIGFTTDIQRRLREYPPGAILLASEPGGEGLERQRHEQFSTCRLTPRGEWFALGDDLLAHIESLNCEPRAAA